MLTTFYRQKITKQQFDFIQSNWKNISEIEEETDILDTPKNRMKMNLRVPIKLNGRVVFMTVNCRILALEDDQSIHLKVIGNIYKPIFVSVLAASPIALVGAVILFKPYLFILILPLVALIIFYNYFKRVKTVSQNFVKELLKAI